MNTLLDTLFHLTTAIRYVSIYSAGQLFIRQRPDILHASASDSDRYEELLVNPTLLTLTRQRGEIDCGGLMYMIIRYGFFFQLVIPLKEGHISIAFEPEAEPMNYVGQVTHLLHDHALLASG